MLGGGQEGQGLLPLPRVAPWRPTLTPLPTQQWPEAHIMCNANSGINMISPRGDPGPGVPGPGQQLLRLVGAGPGHQPHGGLVQEQSEHLYLSSIFK